MITTITLLKPPPNTSSGQKHQLLNFLFENYGVDVEVALSRVLDEISVSDAILTDRNPAEIFRYYQGWMRDAGYINIAKYNDKTWATKQAQLGGSLINLANPPRSTR